MGNITDQPEGLEAPSAVRCPICGQMNAPMRYCRHVRWTFDQGDPIEFARFAIETSPYVEARGFKSSAIPRFWWDEHGEWVVEQVLLHFDALDGYVFGDLSTVDLLARHIWLCFRPDPIRPSMVRH